jgi:hypothetical protein
MYPPQATHSCWPLSSSLALLGPGFFEAQPLRVLTAMNTVLFEFQGYGSPCQRFGNARDMQLSCVMEDGKGCSATLSLLYKEVGGRHDGGDGDGVGGQQNRRPCGSCFIVYRVAASCGHAM